MAEVTKKEFDQLKKEVEQLRKEKAEREATAVDNLDEHIAGKEKLLAIELKIAQAIGDSKTAMEKAVDINKLWEKTQEGAYEQGSEAAQKFADSLGMSMEEVQRLIDLQADLGEVGMAAYDTMKSGAEDVAVKMGLVSKRADSIVGGIIKIGKMAASKEGIKGMALALKDTLKPTRILSSLLLKLAENTIAAVFAADKASAAFARQTGMGRVHTAGIAKLGTEHRNLGIDVELAGKAYTSATEQLSGFNSMSSATQDKVTLLGASMERLGVGATEGMAMVEEFRKSLGVTTNEAADMTREMALTAKGLGVSMGTFVKGFKSANKTLAVYGKKAPKIFGNVAAMARAANVEVDALLGLAGKFDTFTDAAQTTGKLNAILGTQMSAMDLLSMKEDERLEYLMRNMQATGKQFGQMDRFTQKAVANAAGITDMAQANKIFGMSFKDYKKNQRDMAAQEKSQEEMNKRMEEAMSIVESLKAIMAEFVIKGIGPHIDTIKNFVRFEI